MGLTAARATAHSHGSWKSRSAAVPKAFRATLYASLLYVAMAFSKLSNSMITIRCFRPASNASIASEVRTKSCRRLL